MGGGHGAELPKIPDYRIYKTETVPELMTVQRALAQRGLKDPWLRYVLFSIYLSFMARNFNGNSFIGRLHFHHTLYIERQTTLLRV